MKPRKIIKQIREINRRAREHRIFGEEKQARDLYAIKASLLRKHGTKRSIHIAAGRELVAYDVGGQIFHLPKRKDDNQNLKVDKTYKHKIGARY